MGERRRVLQQVLLFGAALSLLAISVIAFVTPPASGYEWSIYRALPTVFWVFLVFGLVASVVTILLATVAGNPYWKHAFVLVLALYLVYLLLPLFRGYYLYGRPAADVFVHIGYTKSILTTGRIFESDWYPLVHLLFAALYFLDTPLNVAPTVLSTVMVELYLVGIFLYVRAEFESRTRILATLAVSVPLLFQRFIHTTHPAILSFFLFPYVLLTYKKLNHTGARRRQALLLVLLGSVLVIFHPITILLVVLSLVLLFASAEVYLLIYHKRPRPRTEVPLAFYFLGLFLLWYLSFNRTFRKAESVIRALTGGSSQTIASSQTAQVAAAPGPFHIVRGLVESYGPIFLFAAVAGLAVLSVLSRIPRKRGRPVELPELEFSVQFVAGGAVALLFILFPLIVSDPVRVSRYMIVMSTLLVGVYLSGLLSSSEPTRPMFRRVLLVAVVVVVLVSVPLTVLYSYNSNMHMTSWTEADHDGSQWLIENREPTITATSLDSGDKLPRYHAGQGRADRVFVPFNETVAYPKEFGYGHLDTLGDAFPSDRYLVTKEYDRYFYLTQRRYRRPTVRRYTENDLEKLSRDRNISRVYSNGGYQIWLVNTTGSPDSRTTDRRSRQWRRTGRYSVTVREAVAS